MTFKDLAKRIATCYNSLPALVDALRDGFNEVEAGGGGSSEINYSTDEQVIGTWIDDKPLYQKSFHLTTPSETDSAIVIQNIADLNIDTPVNIFGNVLNVPINFFLDITQSNYIACFINSAKTGIAMKLGANTYVSKDCNVTILYTKTTD